MSSAQPMGETTPIFQQFESDSKKSKSAVHKYYETEDGSNTTPIDLYPPNMQNQNSVSVRSEREFTYANGKQRVVQCQNILAPTIASINTTVTLGAGALCVTQVIPCGTFGVVTGGCCLVGGGLCCLSLVCIIGWSFFECCGRCIENKENEKEFHQKNNSYIDANFRSI